MKRTTFYLQAALLLIITGLITGCASGLKYVEPSSGPTASIRFVASSLSSDKTEGKANVFIHHVEGACVGQLPKVGILHGPSIYHDRKNIGMPLSDGLNEKDFTEIKVPAGLFGFDMDSLNISSSYTKKSGLVIYNRHCNDTVEFEAVAGRLYEAELVLDPKGCAVTVNELVVSVGEYVRQPEKTARRRPDKCNWQ